MFKCIILSDTLKETLKALTALVDEAKVNITRTGISVSAVDPANVAMVSLSLEAAAFKEFKATEGMIGLDFTKLEGVLELAEKGQNVTLNLDEKEHKLQVIFQELTYTLSLLDPSSIRKEPKIPIIDLPVEISISGTYLRYGFKAAEMVGDYATFGMKDKDFFISASGGTDDVKYNVQEGKFKTIKSEDASALFAMEYLTKILKISEKNEEVSVLFGTDFPIKIGFGIADGNGKVEYMIAPRVETE